MTTFEFLHWAVLLTAGVGVVCWYKLARRHHSTLLFIAMELWLINVIVFSVAVLLTLEQQPSMNFALWNAGIKLQGIIVIAGEGLARVSNWKRIDD